MKTALIEKYDSYIRKLVHRMIHNRQLAEDAIQEVWLEIFKSVDKFQGKSQLSTWIYTIASRVVLAVSRAEMIHSHEAIDEFFSREEMAVPPEVEQSLWIKEKCDLCLTSFLRCLSHEDRLALLLKDFLELEYTEVATILGNSEPTIRKQVSRARQKVSGYVEQECALVNQNGSCRCRIRTAVADIDFPKMYNTFAEARRELNTIQKLDQFLPDRQFWEKFI